MSPSAGQGANTSIEDATVLAHLLSRPNAHENVTEVFKDYQGKEENQLSPRHSFALYL